MLAAAFSLRIGIVVIGPVVEDIRADTGMSSGLAGVLTMIPFLCMGLFAFLGPPLVRAVGSPRVVIGALALIAAGSALRAVAGGAWPVLAGTFPIGLGIALIGVTLPAIVKERFPRRPGAVTGAYVASTSIGIVIVGFGLVPLAGALGGWRPAFLLTALPPLVAIAFWLGESGTKAGEALSGRPWIARPGRTGLLLGAVFGLQSMCFAGMVSWAPTIYEEAGWSQSLAAMTTTSIGAGTLIAALIFPSLTDGRDRRPWIAAVAAVMAIGVTGAGLGAAAAPWLWLIAFGLGTGAIFALLMALPLDIGRDSTEVAELAAWMLGIGCAISGLAPILVGTLRDAIGGFELPMALLGFCGLASGLLALLAPKPAPDRFVKPPEADWREPGMPALETGIPAVKGDGIDRPQATADSAPMSGPTQPSEGVVSAAPIQGTVPGAIKIEHLSKTYTTRKSTVEALRDATFSVVPGEFVALVGPSGCGKSTLLHIVSGLLDASGGDAVVAGSPAQAGRRDVGIMLQRPVLFPWRNVLGNVMMPIDVFKLDKKKGRERAEQLIELVGLGGFEEVFPWELSGGMQQRVSLARLLVFEPQILLMDEPFAALDEFTRERLNSELAQLHESLDRTVLYVTHNIQEAVFLADRVVVMKPRPGEILEIIDIPLPRPRQIEMVTERETADLVAEIRTKLGFDGAEG